MTTPEFSSEQPKIEVIGEPVTRPDGIVVQMVRDGSLIVQNLGGICFQYTDAELEKLGDGNWDSGFMLVAQNGYSREYRWADLWKDKPFYDDLKGTDDNA